MSASRNSLKQASRCAWPGAKGILSYLIRSRTKNPQSSAVQAQGSMICGLFLFIIATSLLSTPPSPSRGYKPNRPSSFQSLVLYIKARSSGALPFSVIIFHPRLLTLHHLPRHQLQTVGSSRHRFCGFSIISFTTSASRPPSAAAKDFNPVGSNVSSTITTRGVYHMPHKKIYVETDRYGNPQWILKRSSSCREERRANITESELRELQLQNEELIATNANLSTSVQTLKVDLDRQAGLANHWYREAQGVIVINRDLRAALENSNRDHDRETRSLRLKYTATKNALDEQKNENRSLITRLREKIELVARLEDKVASLKQRYQDALDNFAAARAANARFNDENARLRADNERLRDEIAYLRRPGFL